MDRGRHTLLLRQLKRHLGGTEVPAELAGFVDAVDQAYRQSDVDRGMLERSLELSSQELIQATSEMRTVFAAIPDLIFRIDREGRIVACHPGNPADVCRPSTELVGKLIHRVPEAEVGRKLGQAVREVRATRSLVTSEYALEIGGLRRWYEARLVPLLDAQIIVLIRNVTARKQAEDERLRLSKLDSLGVLAGGVAHDFNNILSAITGNLSLAKLTVSSPEVMHDMLSDIEIAALRAQKLVTQLATFARGGIPNRKVAQLAPLLRHSAEFALSGSNVTCDCRIADDLSPVSVDEGQLGQVIDNLVINAKQAMSRGGTVRLRAENVVVEERDPAAARLPAGPGRYVRIVVQDHGVGIPRAHLPRIFDPYFTTKENGTGLGLATTYSIVKRHDGHIGVDSEVGRGTTFTIHLPASCERPARGRARAAAKRGCGRVLLMDDEEMVRVGTARMLEHLGYSVRCARNGEQAIALFRAAMRHGRPFDVVIMDLTIRAGMGGKETLPELRALDPRVRTIVSSGYSDDPVVGPPGQHGFDGVLSKPYTIHQLGDVLHEVAASRWRPRRPRAVRA